MSSRADVLDQTGAVGAAELIESLDLLVDRLERAGSPIRTALRSPRPAPDVARHFTLLGLHPTSELVDLFSWHDGVDGADLFWETNFHPLSETTAVWRLAQSIANEDPQSRAAADRHVSFPGPVEWFPALFMDGNELLVIDNSQSTARGSVWFTFTQSEPAWVFDSLLEGVQAAVWCVERGLWRPDNQGRLECDRGSMPSRDDRNHPPWSPEPR
jgi:hypothetical protein